MVEVFSLFLLQIWSVFLSDKIIQIKVDPIGNYYTATENEIIQWSSKGDTISYFNNKSKTISSIDVSNPLSILVFYNDFDKIDILDRSLNFSQSILLFNFNIKDASAICRSKDNAIWVLDDTEHTLTKLNDQNIRLPVPIDLKIFQMENWSIQEIVESDNDLYLVDSLLGIVKLDYWGNYKGVHFSKGISNLQIKSGNLFFLKNNTLHKMESFTSEEINIGLENEINVFTIYQDKLLLSKSSFFQVNEIQNK